MQKSTCELKNHEGIIVITGIKKKQTKCAHLMDEFFGNA